MKAAPLKAFHHSLTSQNDGALIRDTASTRISVGTFADISVGPRAVDLHEASEHFPAMWQELMELGWEASVRLIQYDFNVVERTAQRWTAGKGGVRSPHHVIALRKQPQLYIRIIGGLVG